VGIETTLKRTTPQVLDLLRNDPVSTQIFALLETKELTEHPYRQEPPDAAYLATLKRFTETSAGLWLLDVLQEDDPPKHALVAQRLPLFQADWQRGALDLYKTWHALHYLLCGSAERTASPLSRVVLGSQELAPPLDDPQVSFMEAAEVVAVANQLATVEFEALAQKRRGVDEPEVYHWHCEDDLTYLEPYLHATTTYYAAAAESGDAMLMWR